MRLPKFEYLRPATVDEVCRLLKEHGSRACVAAGGTDLFPRLKYGLMRPEWIISMEGLPVGPPTVNGNGELCLSSLMTLADLARSREVQDRAPLLSAAALRVASNQVRHMGTLGGNLTQENRCLYYNQTHTFQFVEPCFKRGGDLCYFVPKGKGCWAVFCSDVAPALISLDAQLNIHGPEKTRRLPLESFYTGDALAPRAISSDEVVTEVIVPGPATVRGSGFAKSTLRGGMEFAALNVAVVLDMAEDNERCHAARITVGAVSAAPLRARKAEKGLIGQHLSADLCREAARTAASEIQTISHHGYSVGYLRACLETETGRALVMAAEGILQREDGSKQKPGE